MKRSHCISASPSRRETLGGFSYLAFQMIFLPGILYWINGQLSPRLSDAELNFAFYLINFISILLIFREFLGKNLKTAGAHPVYLCQAVILALAAYWALSWTVSKVLPFIDPAFVNRNDASIAAMSSGNWFLMLVGTVVLVPPVEECLYRGLVFRTLYGKSRWAAYTVSIVFFAAVHLLGYLGQYTLPQLLAATLQYLPGGLCLAWCYAKSDSIFAPILVHAVINFIGIQSLR